MNRRKFLHRIAASASLAAADPLIGDAPKSRELPAELSNSFLTPPQSAAPWVYWVWLGVDTTPAAMTYDLEQMKAKGIRGFILYGNQTGSLPREIPARILTRKNNRFQYEFVNTGDYDDFHTTPLPFPPLPAWTPLWRERIRYVSREAARLDLEFCLTLGLAGTSAQIPEEYGNQELIWTETPITGERTFNGILPAAAPHQPPSGYRREVAVLAIPDAPNFSSTQVLDLTAKMDAAGYLNWKAPPGNWTILRFSQVATGARNQWGFFSDAMNPEALDKLWEVTMAPLLQEMSAEERNGLTGIEDDSWEGGEFTWTKNFPEEFRKRRGYNLMPYLPVLAGASMEDPIARQQVKRDYDLTISDLLADYHYGHLERLCKDHCLTLFAEAAGPNLHRADLLKTSSEVDEMMAEFWMPCFHRPSPASRYLSRNAACASHIYGRAINMDEAFTSLGPEWEESPFHMKPVADQAFCDGVNRICVHNFSHSPSLTARPGYVYVAGTHYEPRITWWEQAPAFNTYLARCSYLLQQGKFVADAIFYKGDNLGDGEPMKLIHPDLGQGYDYDCSNSDVLLRRMSVRDGRIVLPDGMSYRVLILPENQPVALNALQKLADLIKAGATVVGPPPARLAGLPTQPDETRQFKALISELWGNNEKSSAIGKRQIGLGYLVTGQSARTVLQDAGVPPDFEYSGASSAGEIRWIHRKMGGIDIYFVTSHWQPEEHLECTFRVSGRKPELWDPVTGAIREAAEFRQSGGRTTVPLQFDPCGSIFVVFRKPGHSGAARTRTIRTELTLPGPWTVSFDPNWGGPKNVTFDRLLDWTAHAEPGIKYYSGAAVYRTQFNLAGVPGKRTQLLLDLGELHEVASVRLNGRDLGVVWTKPARVDIADSVRPGSNDLEVTDRESLAQSLDWRCRITARIPLDGNQCAQIQRAFAVVALGAARAGNGLIIAIVPPRPLRPPAHSLLEAQAD